MPRCSMADRPRAGKIEIEWVQRREDPDEIYYWKVTCFPSQDPGLVADILSEIAKVERHAGDALRQNPGPIAGPP